MNKHKKGFAPIIIALIVLILAGIGGVGYYLISKENKLLNSQKQQLSTIPSIKINSPKQGESLETGKTYDIAWSSQNINKISFYLVRQGATDVVLTMGDDTQASLGKYSWTIPTDRNDINLGGQFRIGVFADDNNMPIAYSDWFSIIYGVTSKDWKKYTNEKLGFEIKYPLSGWGIGVDSATGVRFEDFPENPMSKALFVISTEEETLDQFISDFNLKNNLICKLGPLPETKSIKKIEDLVIGGLNATKLLYCNGEGGPNLSLVFIRYGNKSFIIHYRPENLIHQEMLSTFKLVDISQNKDWKIYVNSKYNYQISYPEDIYTIENITSDPKKVTTFYHVTLYDIKSVQKTKECECGEYSAIYIDTYSNPQGLSLSEYIKQNINYWFDGTDYSNLLINEVTNLNGIKAIKIGMEREQYYVLERNNTIFSIGGYADMEVINTFKLK